MPFRHCLSAFGILAILMGTVSPAVAQDSPDSLNMFGFGDSVRRVTDVASLTTGLEAAKNDRFLDRAWRESQKGWIALRLAELEGGRDRLDEAVRYFDEAVYRDRTFADGWVGLAEAKLLLEQRNAVVKPSMHQQAGDYYEDAALQHLATALRHRPKYPAAVTLLGRLLTAFDSPDFPDPLAESIRFTSAHPENGPLPQLLLGRYFRKQHRLESAIQAFQRFIERGGDSGLGYLELARTVYRVGDADSAAVLYLAGASVGDTLARKAFRQDLAWFVTSEELRTFDRIPRDSLGPLIRLVWAARDAASVRPPGDRLKEHLRRWWYVQEHYQLTGRRKKARFGWGVSRPHQSVTEDNQELGYWALFTPGTLPESDPRGLGVDDRGLIYMRHGEPDARASAVGRPGLPGCFVANESWKYELATGPIILHFCASEALGSTAPTTLVPLLPLDPDMVGARINLDLRFGIMELDLRNYLQAVELRHLSAGLGGRVAPRISQATAQLFRARGQASLKVGLTTDSYPLDYEHDLTPTVQIYGLSQSAGAGRALVVFAVRGDRIEPVTLSGRLVYPVQMRITAVDTAQGITRTTDTLRYFVVNDTLGKDRYLYGTLGLNLPSGTYFIRALLEQPFRRAASAVGRADVVVPGAGDPLTMSDLITGNRVSGLVWEHFGRQIPLDPLDAFRFGSSVELYYEVIGAAPNAVHTTRMDLARTGGGEGRGKDRLSISFSENAEGIRFAVQRTVGLGDLLPGRYLLSITVTEEGASPRSVTRERIINVLPR